MVLCNFAGPEAARVALSAVQADAVVAAVASVNEQLTPDERAAVTTLLTAVKFTDVDLTRVLHAVAGTPVACPKRRRAQQNYSSAIHYGPEEVWALLASEDASADSKLDAIMQLLCSLGLRLPSEHTVKLVCSWWLMVSESQERRRVMKRLIETDPERALRLAISAATRAGLPDEVAEQLETPISAAGEFEKEIEPLLEEYCYDCHGDGT